MNSSPTPALFAACVDGKFHGFPWVRDYFYGLCESIWACHTPFFYQIWEKVDIRKGQGWSADPLPSFFACMPCPLSLVSNLEEEASGCCALTFLAIDILYFLTSKLNEKVLRIELKWCLLWAQVSNFNLVKVGYYSHIALSCDSI